jgi:hypothetical protein
MSDDAPLCAFCGQPTVRRRGDSLEVPEWGGTIRKPGQEADFCDNPNCDSHGKQVATKRR